jgi:zinc transporter, ZIP family
MIETFIAWPPVLQAFVATVFTWGLTAAGAGAVFFFRDVSRKALDTALGFTAGVMIAASFWSLLNPAIDMAEEMGMIKWLPALVGLRRRGAVDAAHRLHPAARPPVRPDDGRRRHEDVVAARDAAGAGDHAAQHPRGAGDRRGLRRRGAGYEAATLGGAIALAIGIGIQNCPEGTAVAVPLRREGMSRAKAWWYGQLSAMVEPAAAVAGALAVTMMRPMLPYALAFAAGAMIFVVVEEVIPESQSGGHGDRATIGAIAGFAVMMTLDVALG